MSLDEDVQKDVVCRVRYVNVPDSVTFISQPPSEISVSVRSRGTQLLKYEFGSHPVIDVDYRYFTRGNSLIVPRTEIRAMLQRELGSAPTILAMDINSIGSRFTTRPGSRYPVSVDATVTTEINCRQVKPVVSLTDSVLVYSVKPLKSTLKAISTEPLAFYDVDRSFVRRVRLVAPAGCRVVPDSVEVRVDVQPMLSRSREVVIRPINVPKNLTLVPIPRKVRVDYLVSADNPNVVPKLDVVADFSTLPRDLSSSRIRIRLVNPSPDVHLSVDSVEYLVEMK